MRLDAASDDRPSMRSGGPGIGIIRRPAGMPCGMSRLRTEWMAGMVVRSGMDKGRVVSVGGCAGIADPRFLGKPFVLGLADRAMGAGKEHRRGAEARRIRLIPCRYLTSCLRALDHNRSHRGASCGGSMDAGYRACMKSV